MHCDKCGQELEEDGNCRNGCCPCEMPCHACIDKFDIRHPQIPWLLFDSTRMIVCNQCGNKRCPHASDHKLDCTGSNESGQVGSIY